MFDEKKVKLSSDVDLLGYETDVSLKNRIEERDRKFELLKKS